MRTLAGSVCALVLICSMTEPAHAGTPEYFRRVAADTQTPGSIVVGYDYGGGGFFFRSSADGKFELLCSSAIEAGLRDMDVWGLRELPDRRILLGLFNGLLASDPGRCAWSRVAQLEGRWVTDIVADPDDPAVSYLITSSGDRPNGMYRNDGTSADWALRGQELPSFLTRLLIVKTAEGKRFYQSAVVPQVGQQRSQYSMRVSNDEGMTWAEHAFGETDGSMRLVAVSPHDPDHVVVVVIRSAAMAPDDLLFSKSRGETGSFVKIGTVTTFGGATFEPDGTLYYGDTDQATPGVFKVAQLGEAPVRLSDPIRVGCLKYDADRQLLYACRDWLFGTVDVQSGAFETLVDMRKAERFLDCPDQAATAARCEAQLVLNYCGSGHYPDAPLCDRYALDAGAHSGPSGPPAGLDAGPAVGDGGAGVGGSAGASGRAGAGSGAPQAGSRASAGRAASDASDSDESGCACRSAGAATANDSSWPLIGGAALGLALMRRRRRATRLR